MRTLLTLQIDHLQRERKLVLSHLKRANWVLSATARSLGVLPNTLQRLIDKHQLRDEYTTHNPGHTGRPKKPQNATHRVVK